MSSTNSQDQQVLAQIQCTTSHSLPTTQSSNSVLSLTRVPFRFVIQGHAAEYTSANLNGISWTWMD